MEYQRRVRVVLLQEWYVCKWSVQTQGERTVVEGTVRAKVQRVMVTSEFLRQKGSYTHFWLCRSRAAMSVCWGQ